MEKLIAKVVFGSHLYGTSTPSSDRDFKGIFMPTSDEVLLGRIPKTMPLPGKQLEEGLDGDLYSLHHFLRLATQGQTVAIDMLFCPERQIERGPMASIWDDIRFNREKLLSRRMNAFTGYARGQAAKYSLKGERLNKMILFHEAITAEHNERLMREFWDTLPRDEERVTDKGIRELRIAGKWFGETTQIGLVKIAVNKIINRYGGRAHASREAGNVDWKAMSHAVRVIEELKEILRTGNLVFPLASAHIILSIKRGLRPLVEVQEIIDVGLNEVDLLVGQSNLPDRVDQEFWDVFLMDAVRATL